MSIVHTEPKSQSSNPRAPEDARDILSFLMQARAINEGAADRAAAAQEKTGERIDTILTELGLISAADLIEHLADYVNWPIIKREDFPSVAVQNTTLNIEFLKRNWILPIREESESITVAISDPFALDTIQALRFAIDKPVNVTLAGQKDIEAAINELYRVENSDSSSDRDTNIIEISGDDVQRLHDRASEAPIIRTVSQIISEAIQLRASDIHIEPMPNHVRVRYRIDGFMIEAQDISKTDHDAIASRLKILANLNIAERRLPQDGRIKTSVSGNNIDLRVSTMPVHGGESIVLRILDQSQLRLNFDELGVDATLIQKIRNLTNKQNGLVLVTGPTGSGKTTTLYAALSELNAIERKLFTVEDPIEYLLDGINQIQVHSDLGLNFATALRSILRQDPDIVMVGEMRDVETAKIAMQAALTGHLVLSTLHTNSAPSAVTRLIDMGVDPYLITATLSGVIAQRLVRTLCPNCATHSEKSREDLELWFKTQNYSYETVQLQNVKQAQGCASCHQTGFLGRTALIEMLEIDSTIKHHIMSGATEDVVSKSAQQNGMHSLLQSGLKKIVSGQTTLDEVLRVSEVGHA